MTKGSRITSDWKKRQTIKKRLAIGAMLLLVALWLYFIFLW